jgi:hypothetical protein
LSVKTTTPLIKNANKMNKKSLGENFSPRKKYANKAPKKPVVLSIGQITNKLFAVIAKINVTCVTTVKNPRK